jgi:mannose-6-phosphate isomerase-like protein (cupin superfamily)
MPPRVLNLVDAGRSLTAPWSPVVAGDVNDSQIKLAKFAGAFDWHAHPAEDEAFLVVEGRIAIDFEDGAAELGPGELLVVPMGVRHRPRALTPEALVLMIEPSSTLNTGDQITEKTKTVLERL